MARSKPVTEPRAGNPGFLSRLRQRKQPTTMGKVTREEKTNPLTGTHTETVKRKTKPGGYGDKHKPAPGGVQRRKPGIGDKVGGAMKKIEGGLENKPGKKVSSGVYYWRLEVY